MPALLIPKRQQGPLHSTDAIRQESEATVEAADPLFERSRPIGASNVHVQARLDWQDGPFKPLKSWSATNSGDDTIPEFMVWQDAVRDWRDAVIAMLELVNATDDRPSVDHRRHQMLAAQCAPPAGRS